jgi:RHS repeat-associated protein
LTSFHRGVLNAGGDGIASGLLGRSEAFGLDALGNWLTYGVDATGNGTNDLDQTRAHNKLNEIDTNDDHADAAGDAIAATTGSNWVDPVYDAAGNMTQGPQPHNPASALPTGETNRLHYTYDAWNRMVGVYPDSGGSPWWAAVIYTFTYDGLHRRVGRTAYPGGVPLPGWFFHNASWQVVEERTGSGEWTTWGVNYQYVWDLRYIDSPAARLSPGGAAIYYTTDANLNVTALVSATDGAVVERYRYDPYGKPTVLHGVRNASGQDTSGLEWQERTWGASFRNEILYCGYRYDGGRAGHYHVRYRVYYPTLGRWTARDPIGYDGGNSLYEYAASRPTIGLDPNGTVVMIYGGKTSPLEGTCLQSIGRFCGVGSGFSGSGGGGGSKSGITGDPHLTRIKMQIEAGLDGKDKVWLLQPESSQSWDEVRDAAERNRVFPAHSPCREPIILIGYSDGATRVKEVAERLKEEYPDETVAYVGLIDMTRLVRDYKEPGAGIPIQAGPHGFVPTEVAILGNIDAGDNFYQQRRWREMGVMTGLRVMSPRTITNHLKTDASGTESDSGLLGLIGNILFLNHGWIVTMPDVQSDIGRGAVQAWHKATEGR